MTMSAKEKATATTASEETMEWSAEEEIQLFFALEGLKPVGVNKHFYMACIADRLSKSLNRDVPAEAIWAHLRTLYNLDVLDEMEPLPFPNEQKEFSLPDTEFSVLLSKKRAECEEKKLNVESAGSVPALITVPATPPSIIAVATDNSAKDKYSANKFVVVVPQQPKELEKKMVITKLVEAPKRTPKRTRGSMSLESNSPSTTPPPIQSSKRRRI